MLCLSLECLPLRSLKKTRRSTTPSPSPSTDRRSGRRDSRHQTGPYLSCRPRNYPPCMRTRSSPPGQTPSSQTSSFILSQMKHPGTNVCSDRRNHTPKYICMRRVKNSNDEGPSSHLSSQKNMVNMLMSGEFASSKFV
jgi:hypothetical protein